MGIWSGLDDAVCINGNFSLFGLERRGEGKGCSSGALDIFGTACSQCPVVGIILWSTKSDGSLY